jgi:small subunit ribosomal protein S13
MLYLIRTEIPEKIHLEKGLQCIFGIGKYTSKLACKANGLIHDARGIDLSNRSKRKLRSNRYSKKNLSYFKYSSLSNYKDSEKLLDFSETENNKKDKSYRKELFVNLKEYLENYKRPLGIVLEEIYKKNCKRLININSYKGQRHQIGYPVRGQRTHTNAKSQKRVYRQKTINQVDYKKNIHNPKKNINKKKANQNQPKKPIKKK